ncbi:unnamed protein product, partial [Phaeothamnion confervicola]
MGRKEALRISSGLLVGRGNVHCCAGLSPTAARWMTSTLKLPSGQETLKFCKHLTGLSLPRPPAAAARCLHTAPHTPLPMQHRLCREMAATARHRHGSRRCTESSAARNSLKSRNQRQHREPQGKITRTCDLFFRSFDGFSFNIGFPGAQVGHACFRKQGRSRLRAPPPTSEAFENPSGNFEGKKGNYS